MRVVEQLLDHLDPGGEAHGVGLAELTEVDGRRRRRVVGTLGVEANGAAALVGEQSDEQGGVARTARTEVVHRHDLDHPPAQHGARDETVGGLVVGVPQRQLDDPPDVVAQPFTDTGGVDAGAQQQRRCVDRPGSAHDPVGSDHVAVGGDDPGRPDRSTNRIVATSRSVITSRFGRDVAAARYASRRCSPG